MRGVGDCRNGGKITSNLERKKEIRVLDHNTSPVTILPHAPQKSPQNDDATKAADLKRHARDIARDSHGIEDEIRAMVSSYMVPKDEEDLELAIG